LPPPFEGERESEYHKSTSQEQYHKSRSVSQAGAVDRCFEGTECNQKDPNLTQSVDQTAKSPRSLLLHCLPDDTIANAENRP
jgi:hypothetical protein